MPITDQAVQDVVTLVEDEAKRVLGHGVPMRVRGGYARGTHWVELSGRMRDGAWGEVRVRNVAAGQTLDAKFLAYQPLARGGRTIVIGEQTYSYENTALEVSAQLARVVREWITTLMQSTDHGGCREQITENRRHAPTRRTRGWHLHATTGRA